MTKKPTENAMMEKSGDPRVVSMGARDVFSETEVTAAVIKLTRDGVVIAWLPEVFAVGLPAEVRTELIARLRLHADKLENGETERYMQQYRDINKTKVGRDS